MTVASASSNGGAKKGDENALLTTPVIAPAFKDVVSKNIPASAKLANGAKASGKKGGRGGGNGERQGGNGQGQGQDAPSTVERSTSTSG
jgi:hypothetical protein